MLEGLLDDVGCCCCDDGATSDTLTLSECSSLHTHFLIYFHTFLSLLLIQCYLSLPHASHTKHNNTNSRPTSQHIIRFAIEKKILSGSTLCQTLNILAYPESWQAFHWLLDWSWRAGWWWRGRRKKAFEKSLRGENDKIDEAMKELEMRQEV